MKWQEKGWLKKYLTTRHHYVLHQEFQRLKDQKSTSAAFDQLIYELMQATGLLYGYPAQMPYSYKTLLKSLKVDQLTDQQRWKILLLESLLNSALTTNRYHSLKREVDFADAISEVTYRIGEYYVALYPNIKPKSRGGFLARSSKTGIDFSEQALDARTQSMASNTKDEFWQAIMHSALSFIDVYCFHPWIQSYADTDKREKVIKSHIRLRLLILYVLSSAAWANGIVEKEEKEFLEYFLTLSQLPEDLEEQGKKMILERVSMENIKWSEVKSPVLKRYLLELATMIILSDKVISKSERQFLDELRDKLNLSEKETQHSILAVESFVVEHWQNIPYLNGNKDVEAMTMYLLAKLRPYLQEELPILKKYLEQESGVDALLQRSQIETIGTNERKKIRQGLLAAIQATPAFQSAVVPRSVLTYSVLLETIPGGLFARYQPNNE
ncbi:hypothetical protein [Tunicatimonas pelagia]|uniref:hypothetical protein n=1 Tax=Tunicatimonas pelagia TaxID=931531 RepID=UPI0026663F64|nr:hypothetical protein [Tunicatimonas pelagia]WKN44342.1 hypothetical protein P0M28_05110 [Tunicatimonas pelagia]